MRSVGSVLVALGFLFPQPTIAQCRVTGEGPPEDLQLAEAACERVNHRFPLLFGSATPSGTIELSDTVQFFAVASNSQEWKLIWPTTERLREYFSAGQVTNEGVEEQVDLHWSTVLPHEVGHQLLIAEAERRRPDVVPRRGLPDWLHEGVGVWMEPPRYRQDEYATLRALRPFVPTLGELTSISIADAVDDPEGGATIMQTFYPCASNEACGGRPHWSRTFTVTTRQFPDGRVQVDTVFHDRPPPAPTPTGSHFYTYSAALVRYLHNRGGASAMSLLLDRLVTSPDVASPLAGLPGMPTTPRTLEADWNAWFRRWNFEE